tara:strand:+ start:894 stop:1175 length:282 start_codon:yes stop_codon:yes gene_type:complete
MARLLKGSSTLTGATHTASGVSQSTVDALNLGLAENLKTYAGDVTIGATKSAVICGAVTIPNLEVNGNLSVTTSLNVTTDLDIGASGTLNIIG